MSEEFRFEYDTATEIAARLRTAQDDLESEAPTMPESVDGGYGADFIMSMIAQLGEDAGSLAQAAELGATNMGKAVDLVSGYDDEVAQTLQSMAEDMS
ncbi:hypothetical protein [Actinomyces wuliandei]|uniref:hypothetical protein n=1 Tax=Actinomyces wuliandei TaxID=2057743 RepID=UPI000FDC3EEE|nr:hypothetical protein [Actinomyces wuliandei]